MAVFICENVVIEVVVNMLFDVEMFFCFFVIFIACIFLFNARWICKNKVKIEKENTLVNVVKVISFLVIICSLYIIYKIK